MKDSAIEAGTLARSVSDGITDKAKLKEMPSSGSCITYKILNSLIPLRDSSYLQARLIKVLLQLRRIIHDRHIPMSLAKRYKIYKSFVITRKLPFDRTCLVKKKLLNVSLGYII